MNLFVTGVGQVGAAVIMDILKKRPDIKIVGYDIDPKAKDDVYIAFDRYEIPHKNFQFTNDPSLVAKANLDLIATPVSEYDNVMKATGRYIRRFTYVSDVGSVKEKPMADIQRALVERFGNAHQYVAGHIFNGFAGIGASSAKPGITDGSTVFLCPRARKAEIYPAFTMIGAIRLSYDLLSKNLLTPNKKALAYVSNFWQSLDSKPVIKTGEEHDGLVARLSHERHMIAFAQIRMPSLREAILKGNLQDPGGWLRAQMRITDANDIMWSAIARDNSVRIIESADELDTNFTRFAAHITHMPFQEIMCGPLHKHQSFAKNLQSPRITAFSPKDHAQHDLKHSAFAAFLSMAITETAWSYQKNSGIILADCANPSFKDGTGIMAINDPKHTKSLIKTYAKDVHAMAAEFQTAHKEIINIVRARDVEGFKEIVRDAKAWNAKLNAALVP